MLLRLLRVPGDEACDQRNALAGDRYLAGARGEAAALARVRALDDRGLAVATFQTATLRSDAMYATRDPSIATARIGPAVCRTFFACGFAAPACAGTNRRAAARKSPRTRRLLMEITLIPCC
jgi:hypothetical protein